MGDQMRMRLACTHLRRLRGLKPYEGDEGFRDVLVIAPCNDIHTLGMHRPIDVAFVDEEGLVLKTYKCLAPGRRLRHPGAHAVLERFSPPDERSLEGEVPLLACGSHADSWWHAGERVRLAGGAW